MRIKNIDTAAVIIDMQERLFPHILDHDKILNKLCILAEGLKILQIPIILTEQYTKGLGETLQSLKEVIPAISPVEKMSFSCCDHEPFDAELGKYNRNKIIIAGIETHVCVLQTAVDLLEKGYQPVIIEDCVGSRNLNDKEIAIERMRQEGAIISTCESVLFELTRISGTDSFKKISRLVK